MGNSVTVYVVHRGMHAALIVPRERIEPGVWPLHRAAPATKYLEVGWGDNEGYRFEWTTRIVTRAVFWPTPAVLLVRGFDQSVLEEFAPYAEEIIELQIPEEGFAGLCAYVQSYYQVNAECEPIPLGEAFYAANGKYHLFRNSNHWAASALRQAGCPTTPFWAITADIVMFQTRRFGRVLWPPVAAADNSMRPGATGGGLQAQGVSVARKNSLGGVLVRNSVSK